MDPFSDKMGFGEHKSLAIELLQATIDILESNNIKYFLISGTLLGLVRHNDFIPWDDDIDIIADSTILDKLDIIVNKNKDLNFINRQYIVKTFFRNKGPPIRGNGAREWRKHVVNGKGLYRFPFIDIFIYTQKDNILTFFNKKWDAEQFFPEDKVPFLGLNVSVPRAPHYFLSLNYGDNYMTVYKSSSYNHKKEESIRKVVTKTIA